MENEPKRLKIPATIFMAHRATKQEWERATPPMAHRSQPSDPLVIKIPGKPEHAVEVRTDDDGNLFLELKK